MEKDNIRETTVSSIFYPGKKDELIQAVRDYLENSSVTPGEAQIILSPHAGYSYAGKFMADAFNAAAARDIKRIFIISRVHREPEKKIFLPSYTAFDTPAGTLKVEKSIVDKLLASDPLFVKDDIPHTEEHSIEVQLPFIKYLWPDTEIIPVLTGFPSLSIAKKLSAALKTTAAQDFDSTLFVVSSNLSDYGHIKETADDTDYFLELLDKHKWEEFPVFLEKKKINACSADALTALYLLFDSRIEHRLLSRDCGNGLDDKIKSSHSKRVCFGAISFYTI